MTVAEFATFWSTYNKTNTYTQFIYNGTPKSLYTLTKIKDYLYNFTIEIVNKKLDDTELFFYSDDYDLADLNEYGASIIDSLHISYPDNTNVNTLIINIKGGQ